MCKRVWCGRWHLLHQCEDLQSLRVCRPLRHLMQRLFLHIVEIMSVWDMDLNLGQMYRGWCSVLQRMQLPKVSELAVKVVIGGSDFLGGFLFAENSDASDGWALRSRNSRISVYEGTSVLSWLCHCHSNMASTLSFSSMTDMMNDSSGSALMAFNALKCCWIMSCSLLNCFPLPFFKEEAFTILRTWARWKRWGWLKRVLRQSIASL